MNNNNLNQFNTGGTHEQNPLSGIPQGSNATVEQGETSTKTPNGKYIYSNRLYINEDLVKQFNLPNSIKGKTFADASKIIDKPFKDKNSNPDKVTHKEHLDRLKQAQEAIKAQDEQRAQQIAQSMQANSQQIPDQMNGQIPEGMEEYVEPQNNLQEENQEQPQMAYGGRIPYLFGGNQDEDPLSKLSSLGVTAFQPGLPTASLPNSQDIMGNTASKTGVLGKTTGPGVMGYVGAAQGALSLGNLANGKGASTDKFSSALSGAQTGAQAGMAFGPWGAGVGAALGIGAGLLGSNKANKAHLKELGNNALIQNKQFSDSNFSYGGNMKQLNDGGPVPFEDSLEGAPSDPRLRPRLTTIDASGLQRGLTPTANSQFSTLTLPNYVQGTPTTTPTSSSFLSKAGDYIDRNGGKFLKYAPVAMNTYQLAKLKKPVNKQLQRLGDKYTPNYVDESRLQNIADQELNNNINEFSQIGGSQGAVRSAILGAGLNKTKALSDAYMKANELNRGENERSQQFNLGVNQFNAQTQHKESEQHEQNDAAYRNEKSKYLASIGTDLGQIGREEVNKNQIAEALGYSWDGKYMVHKKTGEKLTEEQMKNKINGLKDQKTYSFKDDRFNNTSITYPSTNFKIGR